MDLKKQQHHNCGNFGNTLLPYRLWKVTQCIHQGNNEFNYGWHTHAFYDIKFFEIPPILLQLD